MHVEITHTMHVLIHTQTMHSLLKNIPIKSLQKNPNPNLFAQTMTSLLHSFPLIAITSVSTLFLISLLPVVLSQDPTLSDCISPLLPLTACAPFVQGTAQAPAQPCCDNLNQLYVTQQECLCLLLNDTSLNTFPINRTLALQLPDLCRLQADLSVCSGKTTYIPIFFCL